MKKDDNLEFRKFTTKSEADKAINSLKGIISGINIDNKINDLEINELQLWSKAHYSLINKNPFREFMLSIDSLILSNEDRQETIKDIYWLLQKYESGNIFYDVVTANLQELHGICHGILADGNINDEEIVGLHTWIKQNEQLISYYPYDEIYTIVTSVLSDGIIEDDERLILKAVFKDFVSLSNKIIDDKIVKEISNVNVKGICNLNTEITFPNKNFCLTGAFKNGSKNDFKDKIEKLGGFWKDKVSGNVNYLIVGDKGNPSYTYACYGRKIEDAVVLRKYGNPISIIHEFDFWDYLEDAL